MAYDFVLFAPDAQPLVGDGAWHQLRLRLIKAETTSTATLEQLRDAITNQAQFLPREGITLADSTAYLKGDRCLVVSVTDSSVQEAAVWLLSLATQQQVGLATATDQEVILVGDENHEFSTETAGLELPVVSPGSLPSLLDEVRATQTSAEAGDFVADMLIVTDNRATERYLQATFDPEADNWLVELRDGSVAHHYHTRIDETEDVQELFSQFIARDPALRQATDWAHLDIPEAAIDYQSGSEDAGR